MISHELKCIFIHIPRTAGSSIEQSLIGQDWWSICPKTKHLFASQAKKLYAEYWDNYFKFSFVRNPYSRMLSMTRFKNVYYNSQLRKKILSEEHINNYKHLFGSPILLEYDYRFHKREDIQNEKHKKNCVYENILDEPVDYIGRFETIEYDFNNICNIIGKKAYKLPKFNTKLHTYKFTSEAKLLINQIYEEDFLTYNYNKEE